MIDLNGNDILQKLIKCHFGAFMAAKMAHLGLQYEPFGKAKDAVWSIIGWVPVMFWYTVGYGVCGVLTKKLQSWGARDNSLSQRKNQWKAHES